MKKLYLFCRLHLLLLLVLCSFSNVLFAQHRVSGAVSDGADATPLIGVTVFEKGTNNGSITDVNGNYALSVSQPSAVLVFRYSGYTEQEIGVEGRTVVDVQLGAAENLLDQVVVVGYGTQKKSDLTGAVGTVKTKDLERIATGSLEQALQGKIAGVYVTPTSGEPGAGAVIRIRGTGTLNNSNPVYVVDGMITYDASFVNPQDVQSVEVLKDASACAIYGARGANGVILITTKNGKKREKALISLNTYLGTQQATRKLELLNAAQFGELYNELINQAYYPDPAALGAGTDWQDVVFQDAAPIGNVQLSAAGGSERFSYSASANYFNQEGILRNGAFERVTVRLNNEFKANSWLTLGNNLAYANTRGDIAPSGVIGSAYRIPPVFGERDSSGKFSDPTKPFGLAIANPAADLFYKSNNSRGNDRFFGTLYGDVVFLKYFRFRSNFGFDLDNGKEQSFTPKFEVSPSQINKDDRLSVGIGQKRDWIWEQTLTFEREWEKHKLNVVAGYTAEERRFQFFNAGRSGFPGASDAILYLNAGNDTTQTNSGGANDEALTSYLFRSNYGFLGRYLLTVSLRLDQSSRFLEKNRTGVFPSVGLGWNAAQEPFLEEMGLFDRLKLRVSYGLLGNQNSLRNRYYPSLGVINTGLYAIFGPDESLNQGGTLISLGNPDLVWETTRQLDAGVEIGLFQNRFSAEIDWYQRNTYDIIAAIPIPDYVGSQDDPIVNTAEVRNRGWDVTLNWRQSGRFTWSLGAIFSPVQNEVIALNEQRAEIFDAFLQGEPATRTTPGLPIGAFYGFKTAGVFQTAEEARTSPRLGNEGAGDLRYADLDGNGKIDGNDRTYLGSPIPTLSYGFNAGFEWAGFDLAADLFGVRGNKIYNAKQTFRFSVYNWEKSFYERWTPQTPSATKPRTTNGGHNYRVSDRFLEDGSFVRLRSVVLGYTLPQNWLNRAKIGKFRVYAGATNLWTSQQYSGYSPEFPNDGSPYSVGFDNSGYPVTKSVQAGLELTF